MTAGEAPRSGPPWRLLAVTILIVTLSTQPVFLLGAGFLQLGDDLGFGPAGLGALTAAFFLTASAASAPLGRVVQRIGWRTAIRVNAVASGTLLLVIAAGARHVAAFAVLLVAGGVVYGLANPAANQALADYVDPRRRALFFGLKHAGIPSSTLLAGLAVPLVIVGAGWRVAYAAAAVLALIVLTLVPGADGRAVAPPAVDPGRRVAQLDARRLALLSAGAALATWAAVALATYLVAAAVDKGFSESAAGLLLFAGSAASILGRVTAGAVTDRTRGRGFAAMALLTALGAAVFALLPIAAGGAFVALVPVAFVTGWGWPGLMTYSVVNANTGTAAASSAVTQAGIFAGAGLGPLVLGWVVATWSFSAMWLVVAGALAVATVVVGSVGVIAVRGAAGHPGGVVGSGPAEWP